MGPAVTERTGKNHAPQKLEVTTSTTGGCCSFLILYDTNPNNECTYVFLQEIPQNYPNMCIKFDLPQKMGSI